MREPVNPGEPDCEGESDRQQDADAEAETDLQKVDVPPALVAATVVGDWGYGADASCASRFAVWDSSRASSMRASCSCPSAAARSALSGLRYTTGSLRWSAAQSSPNAGKANRMPLR